MKEEWLKDIHNQMVDYEVDEPENLWEQIQTKISEEEKKRNRVATLLWVKRFVAVAAILILFFSVSYYLNKGETPSAMVTVGVQTKKFPNNEDHTIVDRDSSVSPFSNDKEATIVEKNTNQSTSEEITSAQTKSFDNSQKKYQNKRNDEILKVIGVNDNAQVVSVKKNMLLIESQDDNFQLPANEDELPMAVAQVKTDKKSSEYMSFGVFTSGGTSSSLSSKSIDNVEVQSIGLDKSAWKDSPLLGTLAFNHGRETQTDIKHRQPIRVGLLFNYGITNRIGIESGIMYTNLTSDIREGSENHYFTSQQKLHYLGIPLNLRYKILSSRKFGMYSSLGVLSEKNISGEFSKTYFIDNQKSNTENEKIKINTLQWSVNASLGIQYNFSSLFGIYAEPGVSYYFKDNIPVKTIYTDKPFNFNFNIGVRFTFEK